MLIKIPIPTIVQIILEPPKLINGSAFPANGMMLSMTPILIDASVEIQSVIPAAKSFPNVSGAFTEIAKPRHKNIVYKMMTRLPPISPVSSRMTA